MNKKILTIGIIAVVIIVVAGYFVLKLKPLEIQPSKPTLSEIQFTDMNEQLTCISPFDLRDSKFIINSNQEYQALLDYKSPSTKCEDFQLPSIDFSQYTLLGKYAQGGGCSIDFVRKIYKDESNKKITYSISVVEEGLCKMLAMSINWILIPKIPSNYDLDFEVKFVGQYDE